MSNLPGYKNTNKISELVKSGVVPGFYWTKAGVTRINEGAKKNSFSSSTAACSNDLSVSSEVVVSEASCHTVGAILSVLVDSWGGKVAEVDALKALEFGSISEISSTLELRSIIQLKKVPGFSCDSGYIMRTLNVAENVPETIKSSGPMKKPCKYGARCRNFKCKFFHKGPLATGQADASPPFPVSLLTWDDAATDAF